MVTVAPTIMFCIGAQKAGTTWFYQYLRDHPECHVRDHKEIHYFDSYETGGIDLVRNELLRKVDEFESKALEPKQHFNVAAKLKVLREFLDRLGQKPSTSGRHAAYLEFLSEGLGDKKLMADVTPAYATCSDATFKEMAALGHDVRFVFLLRDPVKRMWSNLRMTARKRPEPGLDETATAHVLLEKFLNGDAKEMYARSDYRRTLKCLANEVAPSKRHVAFFEEIFDGSALAGITKFLEIDAIPGDVRRSVNTGSSVELSGANARRAVRFLQDQYDAVREYTGRLPEQWLQTMKEAA